MPKLNKKKWLTRILAAALLIWMTASAAVTWRLTRRPRPLFPEPASLVQWAETEDRRITTTDGEEIGAWFTSGQPSKGCVLLLHGNFSSRTTYRRLIPFLAAKGYTVMAISLRAHGDSTGTVNDFGWSARHDVIAAIELLEEEVPGRPIFVVGRSAGAAAAIFASEELGERVSGYFLSQPFKNLNDTVWSRLQRRLPPVFDAAAYGGLRLCSMAILPVDTRRVSPYDHVGNIPETVPVVFAAGSADRLTPLHEIKQIAGRVKSHAKLVVFEGAKHEPLFRYDPELYQKTLLELIAPTSP